MKKAITLIILATLLLALPACQLAKESTTQEEYRMVGVFITTQHLDLPSPHEGQEIPMRRGRPDFSALFQPGRIYAQWDEEIGNFRFPDDVEGMPFFTAASPPHMPNITTISHVGGAISGGHTHIFHGDNDMRVELEGTVYIVPGAAAMATIHMNPVFQTTAGDVFLTTGNTFSGHGLTTEGRIFSTNMEESRTITENGKENTNSISVTLNVHSMFSPTSVVLLQMDAYNQVVAHTQFAPEDMPKAYYLEATTAYIIIETHRDDPYATPTITRELMTSCITQSRGISTFAAREDGVLEATWTKIIWPDGE